MSAAESPAESIYFAALAKESPQERAAYLDEACGADADLRRRVERLLQAQPKVGSFLQGVARPPEATVAHAGVPEAAGTVIGPYKLAEQIGEGGMGAVWMAQQTEPVKRLVALKLIKAGMDTKQVIARFEAERQALALMDHPNIARVLDAGTTDAGRPYFVMDLVKGIPITRYCDEHHLTPRQRLELFVPVCQAVQHAHQKGVIHRDLKPSNVLVARYDGRPVPKVIDFGVAKAAGQPLTEQTLVTGFGAIVGTLEYMSPEQAEVNQLDIDTRSDIYSLGVLLYELLAGSPPFTRKELEKAGMLEMLRVIREQEPSRPSAKLSTAEGLPTLAANRGTEPAKLTKLLRGELDWIVLKALEKDRTRRYETANGFARDVQKYLADEPVLACPPSTGYRLRKFARRNRGRLAVAAGACVLAAAVLGSVGWVARDRALREEERQREQAARQARAASERELSLQRAELFQGQGKRAEALAALERAELLASEAPADPARDARLAAVKERLAAEARDQEFIARFEDIRLRAQSQVNVTESRFTPEASYPEIVGALRRYGVAIGVTPPAEAAAYIQGRPESVRREVVAALDECLQWAPQEKGGTRSWLLATLDAADSDAWRVRVRKALADGNWQALEPMVREADVRKQPPSVLLAAVRALPRQRKETRLELLRRIQHAYPADLWANESLAVELEAYGQPAEAVRYYTAALALRPESPGIYLNRGNALREAGEVDAAIADYRQAVTLAPEYAVAHNSLGNALSDKGQLEEAIAEYRESIRIKKDYAEAHYNLGIALYSKGQVDEAIAEYREAIRINKHLPKAHHNLGDALQAKGRLEDAIAEYRAAIRLKKEFAEAYCNLGNVLRRQGQFREALEALRRGDELGRAQGPRWRYPSAQWVRQCERLVELDGRLPDLLEGKATPASPAESIELAQLCNVKRLHRAAARFYTDAFAAEPKLADDLRAEHRYNAACAAALAGCGQGKDADKLDDKERVRLRRQALDWLRTDLEAWGRLLDEGPDRPGRMATGTRALKHWLVDSDFAGVRGPEALARVPEAERNEWQKLWSRVADLLNRDAGLTAPGGK
jgi:serine/threonine protein kinase/Tfp pilus assembly protein PilF